MSENHAQSNEVFAHDRRLHPEAVDAASFPTKPSSNCNNWHCAYRKIEFGEANGGSLFLVVFKEVNNVEVEQDPSTMVTLFWAEGVPG